MFEQDPRTKQTMLNTALKGGLPLRTPMPAGAAPHQGAVATVFNRSKKGAQTSLARASKTVHARHAFMLLMMLPHCSMSTADCNVKW